MVTKNDSSIFLVKVKSDDGGAEEFFFNAPDADKAIEDLEKSYGKKFKMTREGQDIPVLEETE